MIDRCDHTQPVDLTVLKDTLRHILRLGKDGNEYDLTVILVAIDSKNILDEEARNLARNFMINNAIATIKRIIRDHDEIFTLNSSALLVWLRQTHEAGADLVANRIKKALTKVAKEQTGHDVCFLIGAYSEPVALGTRPEEICQVLLNGLELEESCQMLFFNRFNHEARSQLGPTFLCGVSSTACEILNRELPPMGYSLVNLNEFVSIYDEILRSIEHGLKPANSVIVLGEMLSKDEIEYLLKKIRLNRKLDCMFIIVYNENYTPHNNDLLVGGVAIHQTDDPSGRELVKYVLMGYQMALSKALTKLQATYHSILESIKAVSHKLNQPFQIMMGKAEMAIYSLSEAEDMKNVFMDIKKQVLLVSDLNTKIARIASGQN